MIRILVVDDQNLFREVLKDWIDVEEDFEVVGLADNGKKAIEQVELLRPDVVVIDVEMPVMEGLTATKIICAKFPETKIIVLSTHDDQSYITKALRAGAQGYLLKNCDARDLVDAIHSVYKGYSYVAPGLLEKFVMGFTEAEISEIKSVSPVTDTLPLPIPESQLQSFLQVFEPEVLLAVAERTIRTEKTQQLSDYLTDYLLTQPTNLTALYLMGVLYHRHYGEKQSAFDYFKLGFKQGIQQGLSWQDLSFFYQEAKLLKPDDAFEWLIQFYEQIFQDNEDSLAFLLEQAEQLFGTDSFQYHSLIMLEKIAAIREIADSCVSLNAKVKMLSQGFGRLEQLLHF